MRVWFLVILALYTLLSWLVGRQLFDLLRINKFAFWALFIVVAYSPIIGRLGMKGLDTIGNLWMVFFYYAVFLSVLALFIKNKPFLIGGYVLIILAIIYGYFHAQDIKVQKYDVVIPKAGPDLRIVMLSDIHIDRVKKAGYASQVVQDINALNPDLVLLPGDIFDDRDITVLDKEKETLKNIKATYGVFGALGNHEYYSGNLDQMIHIFKEANITILKDEVIETQGIYLVGREDAQRDRKPLEAILHGVNKEKPIILLDHQPVAFDEARDAGVDLQLSGHTHLGQFFPNQLITNRIYEVDYGYLAKDTLQVIVSSGYGTWGPPVRIGTPSEIVTIDLKFQPN